MNCVLTAGITARIARSIAFRRWVADECNGSLGLLLRILAGNCAESRMNEAEMFEYTGQPMPWAVRPGLTMLYISDKGAVSSGLPPYLRGVSVRENADAPILMIQWSCGCLFETSLN